MIEYLKGSLNYVSHNFIHEFIELTSADYGVRVYDLSGNRVPILKCIYRLKEYSGARKGYSFLEGISDERESRSNHGYLFNYFPIKSKLGYTTIVIENSFWIKMDDVFFDVGGEGREITFSNLQGKKFVLKINRVSQGSFDLPVTVKNKILYKNIPELSRDKKLFLPN